MPEPARDRFLSHLRVSVRNATLEKLTLGKYRGTDATLRNVFIRPVKLKAGPHLAFVWRHQTRDITKNLRADGALDEIERLIGGDFLDAHLFTTAETLQLQVQPDGSGRLRVQSRLQNREIPETLAAHDQPKHYLIPTDAAWLRALGVTNPRGQPREGMADKLRQIEKFAELLTHLMAEAGLPEAPPSSPDPSGPIPGRPTTVVDMGSGKGYLTFAIAALLGDRGTVRGVEARPELVDFCNRIAAEQGFAPRLSFAAGTIADAPLTSCNLLVALHACDTATDDALARGIDAGAKLIVVAPCCQKELRPQMRPAPVLEGALRHGIFLERQAEFVTDALRTQLLEWAGYRTKAFEFISTEHTAKNLMIAAIKTRPQATGDDPIARAIREFAAFYGIRHQRLAQHLGLSLAESPRFVPEDPT